MITQNSCKPCITQKTKKNSAAFYDPYSRQYRVTNKLNVWFLIDAMYLWPSDVHWGKHSVWVNMTWCGLQTHNQTKILVRSVETHNCQHSGFILLGTLCWSSVITSRLSLFTFLFLSSNLSCKAERKSQDVKVFGIRSTAPQRRDRWRYCDSMSICTIRNTLIFKSQRLVHVLHVAYNPPGCP